MSQIPTVDFVDKEGALHACAQAGNTPFEALRHHPGDVAGGLLSVEERNAIVEVESFCRKNGLEYEVVDFSTLSFLSKLTLRRRGVKSFPTIMCGDICLHGVPSESDLKRLVKS